MKRALAISILILCTVSAGAGDVPYLQALEADFQDHANHFAEEYNRLMMDQQAGKWDVKRARQVATLFDRLASHPLYRR